MTNRAIWLATTHPNVQPASRVMVRMASCTGFHRNRMCRSAPRQRRDQKGGLDHHAEGGADAQQHQAGVVSVERRQAGMGDQGVEPQEDPDDHQVVGDGHEHGRGELAPGVEQGGEQGDEAVARQLGDEPAQQEDGLVLLLLHVGVVVGDRVQVDDFGGEEEEGDGGGHQDHDGHRDHGGDGLPGLLAPPGAEMVDEHRVRRWRTGPR